MQELIDRLRALLDDSSHEPGGDLIPLRGMHDLLLAMEERMGTIRAVSMPIGVSSQGTLDRLWDKA